MSTKPINAPRERSFYSAKPIADVEEYWANVLKRKSIMNDDYEVVEVEQGDKSNTIMEDLLHRQKIEMKYHDDLDGRTGIILKKTYLNRSDVVEGSVVTNLDVSRVLKFIQESLTALNKKEI